MSSLTWTKTDPNPPNPDNWLICTGCGWLALLTQGNIFACEVGEPCKYCSTPMIPATEADMRKAYPNGQYSLVETGD